MTKKYILFPLSLLSTILYGCAQDPTTEQLEKKTIINVVYPVLQDSSLKYARSKGVYSAENPNDPALLLIDSGVNAYNKNKFKEAVVFYTKSIKLKPYSHAYSNRANALLNLKDTVSAVEDYYKAIAVDSTNPNPYFNLANLQTSQRKYIEALGNYNKSLLTFTKPSRYSDVPISDIYCNRGNCLYYLNDHASSIKDYSEAIKYNPKHVMALVNRADAKFRLRDYNGSIKDYTEAIAISEEAEFYFKRAVNYMNIEKFNEALLDLNKTIQINPNVFDAYKMRAQVKGRQQDYYGAITDIDKMIELQPNNSEGFFMRGLTYAVYLKNTEKGCPDLKRAQELGDSRATDLILNNCQK